MTMRIAGARSQALGVRNFRTLSGRPSTGSSDTSNRSLGTAAAKAATAPSAEHGIPGAAPLSSRLRKSPFFAKTLEAGVAEFTVYNRMLMPLGYGCPQTEYKALTEDAAIWDVAAERQVELKGPDAARLAQMLTCRDVSNLQTGKCVYAIMTDACGVVINDPVLLKLEEDRFWFSIADSDVLLWAKGVATAHMYDVDVSEPDVSPLAIQGPKSTDIMRALYGQDLVDSLKYFGFAHGEETDLLSPTEGAAPIPTLLARSGWSPERGYEIYLKDKARGHELWDLVTQAGAEHGLKPGAPNQQRRVEAGMLSFGGDTLEDTNALELGLPRKFVDPFGPHEFIGKAALQRIALQEGGPRRKLMGMVFEAAPAAGAAPDDDNDAVGGVNGVGGVGGVDWRGEHLPVLARGGLGGAGAGSGSATAQVGVVTACSDSPKFGTTLGIGYVDSSIAEPGKSVDVVTATGNVVSATLSTLPFKSGGRKSRQQSL